MLSITKVTSGVFGKLKIEVLQQTEIASGLQEYYVNTAKEVRKGKRFSQLKGYPGVPGAKAETSTHLPWRAAS